MEEKLMTIEDVSRFLNIPEKSLKNLVENGDLPAYKIGGVMLRFKRDQIERYKKKLDSHEKVNRVLTNDRTAPKKEAKVERLAAGLSGRFESTKSRYSFFERLADFLYYNDFYIVSLILLGVIVGMIFKY